MNPYMDFGPSFIRAHNQQMLMEVNSRRLGERLQKHRNLRLSRVSVFIKRGKLLIGRARLAG